MNPDLASAPDWYPVELDPRTRELTWLHLPGERFLDPFFEDTIRRYRRKAPTQTTSLEIVRAANPGTSGPSAIFFHSSRCGSTLMMQLLGRVENCRALSEPPIMDALLQLPGADDELLAGLVRTLAKTSGPQPTRLFLKLDSWHLPHLQQIRRVFPQSPCFFLYREPEAILRSHRRERGSQMVPGMIDSRRLGIDPESINQADLDAYAAKVLTAIFRDAVTAAESGEILPIAYSQLPAFVWDTLGPALGLAEDGWDDAKERAQRDAKHAHQIHESAPPASGSGIPEELAQGFRHLEESREELQRSWLERVVIC